MPEEKITKRSSNAVQKRWKQLRANTILKKKISDISKMTTLEEIEKSYPREFSGINPDINTPLEEDDLRELFDDTKAAKSSLEDKAKTLVVTLTIATTLCIGLYGVINDTFASYWPGALKVVIAFCAVLSICMMAIAAIKSISIFTAGIYTHVVDPNTSNLTAELTKCIMANRWENLIRANKLHDAFVCLQISLATLLALFIVLTIAA